MHYDINKSFQKLLEDIFFVYKGLRFEKTQAGFVHNGQICRDFHEMDILVEQELHSLELSINRLNK